MITGSCHCGKTGWSFDGLPDQATACNCTICRRYGTLWAYDWLGERVETKGKTAIYKHGDGEIEFHHCPNCGCIMWWQGDHPNGKTRIAVNLRMSENPDEISTIKMRHFDGFDTWSDMLEDGRTVGDMWF